ncbi:MAG: MBL fold metallo-hydrolase [Candidatus Wallbacteria bacterium]
MNKNILITQVGSLQTNCYIIYCEKTKKCAIIDPGAEFEKILKKINALNLIPEYILLTHAHYDHIGSVAEFLNKYKAHNLKLGCYLSEADILRNPAYNYSSVLHTSQVSLTPAITFKDGDIVNIGDEVKLEVIHTPGHTQGGCCYKYDEKVIFSGDTLFLESIGRTDLQSGSAEELFNSIKNKLFKLNDNIVVLPGHGPHTTIGHEKENNIYLK